ncbi:MAG: RNA polymerase sigma factor [Candidatus Kapaibacterium sp.]
MTTPPAWQTTMTAVAGQLYRSFGYASAQDRADALQNALLRLLSLQRASGLRMNDDDMRKWLQCVATRMLVDAYRGRRHVLCFTDAYSVDEETNAVVNEPELDSKSGVSDIGMDIGAALFRLSPSLRFPFELHSQGFTCDEIADILDISRDAAHKRVQRARREMRRQLRDYL